MKDGEIIYLKEEKVKTFPIQKQIFAMNYFEYSR